MVVVEDLAVVEVSVIFNFMKMDMFQNFREPVESLTRFIFITPN